MSFLLPQPRKTLTYGLKQETVAGWESWGQTQRPAFLGTGMVPAQVLGTDLFLAVGVGETCCRHGSCSVDTACIDFMELKKLAVRRPGF